MALARKWPFGKADEGAPPKLVLVLDMGASSTIAALIKLTPPTAGEVATEALGEVVAEACDAFLGASLFDQALFDHFAAKIQDMSGVRGAPARRRGLRLATATERLRKLLRPYRRRRPPRRI